MDYAVIIAAEGLLNHLLFILLNQAIPGQRHAITRVAQRWSDKPFWYIWLAQRQGAYRLELTAASETREYDWVAELAVKYYPSPREPLFHRLSTPERLCRKSAFFRSASSRGGCDCPLHQSGGRQATSRSCETGIPAFAYADALGADLFYAGQMTVYYRNDRQSVVRMDTQSRWQVRVGGDAHQPGKALPEAACLSGRIDRNFPGLLIMRPLYEQLLAGWQHYHRYPVRTQTKSCRDGVIWTDGKILNSMVSPAVKQVTYLTLFSHGGGE